MCGIAGFLTSEPKPEHRVASEKMGQAIEHRGPDNAGQWEDPSSGIYFSFRRLAILDLTADGHQPMHSQDGRYAIIFNGEIYNYPDLRRELFGITFRGTSDTEVLLEGIARWGVEATLPKLNGMFAFAVWDKRDKRLFLARDRAGEKPLYYGWNEKQFYFGSELKSFRAHPDFRAKLDSQAAALFLQLSYIPGPFSIYEGIAKLVPGSFLTIDHAVGSRKEPVVKPYWSAFDIAQDCAHQPRSSASELEALLDDAVKIRMRADVPVGAFLSGGIDSSLIVSLMRRHTSRAVQTFTIGFSEKDFNEAHQAKAVAQHLGTDHTELYVSPERAQQVIPLLPTIYDEPFADSSQIPTYLVSQLARQKVTVSLSGDAGDELFGGYNRHVWAEKVHRLRRFLPGPAMSAISYVLLISSPENWNRVYEKMAPALPKRLRMRLPGQKIHKLAQLLKERTAPGVYYQLVSQWRDPKSLWVKDQVRSLGDIGEKWPTRLSFTEQMMWLDFVHYLPDDILVKVDRASMAVSLEARVPFLDHRVIEHAWRLSLGEKIHDGLGKQVLREILAKHVPRKLFERPKMGFGVPIDDWLRHSLREWAESLLAPDRLKSEGWLNVAMVEKVWSEHLDGRFNHSSKIWNLLMLQAWREQAAV